MVREWLGIDAIAATGKDTTVYPAFAGARASMDAESQAFVNEVANNGTGTLAELLGASWSVIDGAMASLYGVSSAGNTQRTNLPQSDPAFSTRRPSSPCSHTPARPGRCCAAWR